MIEQRRFQQADIIFVTDGEAHVNDEYLRYWNELKKEKGFSVLSLLLGTESINGVQDFSDRVVKASSFEDESVYEAFDI
ncbi:hypothetical protein [Paenibacillus massiliensis]|uniref:hypothetical protein n=1 Tax=Paenibacillus massiliensis TaxID=225917 RepID=UPI0012EB30A7|nr:hypothetical protein [Paenibacillus massiliensis]